MLKLDKLTRRFGENLAVNNANLTIPDGQMVGIIGRSGAGKSTLLRLLNRLIDPSEGQILFGDNDIARLKGKELRAWRSDCAMIFQQFNLVGRLDVVTNVLTGRLHDMPPGARRPRSSPRASVPSPFRRSTGSAWRTQRFSAPRRFRAASSSASPSRARWRRSPRSCLADEPIASLDPMNAKIVMDALRRHQPAGRHHGHLQPAHARHRAQLLRPDHRHAGRAHRVRRHAGSADHRHGARDLRGGGR
jgi:phosphonate transport system ATP-binding protein